MPKVVHIQRSVITTGRAPLRLHNAFLEAGIDSSIISMEFDVNLTDRVIEIGRKARLVSRLDEFLQSFINRNVYKQFGIFSFPILGSDVSTAEMVKNADIIYIHWVQGGFMNLQSYKRLARLGKPVIIFMHDMWTITGGCHHSFDCEKYCTNCFKCQMFPRTGLFDWASIEFRRKKKLYSMYENFYFVSPSKWLLNCTQKSNLTLGKPVFNIPNIIDTGLYKKLDKKVVRYMLNLNEHDTVLSFGAEHISNPYKGWPELLKAMNLLTTRFSREDLTILVFGGGFNKKIADSVPFKTMFTGYLKDEYSTVLVYNASDVFVIPSLADNFPTTVLESQACGTPVVGFNVGGIPDMINHKENGYLAAYKDAQDLANGILYCLDNKITGGLLPELGKSVLLKKHIDLMTAVTKQRDTSPL